MFCTQCGKQYDEALHIPRLLTTCGHTICESCCYRLHNNSKIQCPTCNTLTFTDSIVLLPKNLALINSVSGLQICSKHNKKFQAYCENQHELICIECILQDGHRNHQMDSIKNCYEKYRERWSKKLQKITNLTQKQNSILKQGTQLREDYQNNFQNIKQIINLFFESIHQTIKKQEESLINKIKDTYNQNDSKYIEKINNLQNSISSTQTIVNRLGRYQNLGQAQFLQNFNQRQKIFLQINQHVQELPKISLISFNKKSTIQSLVKIIQGLGTQNKTQKKITTINMNSFNPANCQKKQTQPTSIKAVKKTPLLVNHPSSNQSKKTTVAGSRKQSVNIVCSTPVHASQTHSHTSQTPNQACQSPSQTNQTPTHICQSPIPVCPTPFYISPKIHSRRGSYVREIVQPRQAQQLNPLNLANQIQKDISAVDSGQSLCHSFMSNMTAFLSQRRIIYLIGGFNEEANNIVKYNMIANTWQKVCDLSSNRSKFGSIGVGKQLFLFGGKKGKERVNDSEVYNTTSGKWSKYTPMNKNRSGFSVIALQDLLYFIGGNDGDNILNNVQTLNIKTGQWKKRQPMNQVRDELAVVVGKNNKIYAIGGFGGKNNQPLKSAQVYDPKTQKWKMLPQMNQARRALAASVLADGIYAIGGFDGTTYMKSVQKYQQGNKGWTYITEMKQARCTHTAISIFQTQQIFVFGGFDYIALDSVQRYNIITNEWEIMSKMPMPRFMHSSILIKQD